jgi:uncharacterized protein
MTPAKEEILCRIEEGVRETSGIAFAYLYGSFLESDSYRDVDLGIYAEGADRDEWTKLRDRLHTRLGDLSDQVDIRVLNEAPVTFLYHVLEGRLIDLRNEELYGTVFEQTVRVYLDMAPILRQATREAFGR